MNYLIALLAFSAIMIVLSTLASVLVESIHRLLNTRSRDFDEMLTQLYRQSVRPHFKSAGIKLADDAESFVREIRKNPAISSRRKGLFNTFLVKTEFEELTTRQFVEQFAQSGAGRQLMQKVVQQENELAASTIAKLSYEFERYGQAATEYFTRRAAFFSIVVAFALASTLNIDSLTLYQALSRDTRLAEQVIESIDVEKLQKARVADLAVAADSDAQETVNEKYDAILNNYRKASAQLEGLSLPLGHDFFPFCAKGSDFDPRCKIMTPVENVQLLPAIDPALSWLKHFFVRVGVVLSSQDGLVWLFRIIITTGLIGLGAPFWYKTYRSVGQLIPGRRQPASESTAERSQGVTLASYQAGQPVVVEVQKATVPVSAEAVSEQPTGVSRRSLSRADADGAGKKEKPVPTASVAPAETPVMTTVPSTIPVPAGVAKGLLKEDLVNIFRNTSTAHDTQGASE